MRATKRWSAALCGTLMVLVAALTGACSSEASGGEVAVLGPSTGEDEERIRTVLDAFEDKHDIKVNYLGTRALSQVLLASAERGTPPDVAMLPSPGDLARYVDRGDLQPLDDVVGRRWRDEYPPQWQQLARAGKDRMYAVPVQVSLKSLVWFNPGKLRGGGTPKTFQQLMEMADGLAADGVTPWCLGVASQATSGWPGTDWIEDIVLKQSGVDAYQRWVGGTLPWTSEEVSSAFRTWGEIAADPQKVLGGSKAALLTDYADAGRGMLAKPADCALEHQASFMAGIYAGYESKPAPEEDFDYFPFPSFAEGSSTESWQVGADLAGMFNDTPQSRELIRFLASAEAQEIWVRAGTTYSANADVDKNSYADDMSRRLAAPLTGKDTLCFDGSDLMPATMRSAFYRAVLEYLSDPDQLDTLLRELDGVADSIPRGQWLSDSCGEP